MERMMMMMMAIIIIITLRMTATHSATLMECSLLESAAAAAAVAQRPQEFLSHSRVSHSSRQQQVDLFWSSSHNAPRRRQPLAGLLASLLAGERARPVRAALAHTVRARRRKNTDAAQAGALAHLPTKRSNCLCASAFVRPAACRKLGTGCMRRPCARLYACTPACNAQPATSFGR